MINITKKLWWPIRAFIGFIGTLIKELFKSLGMAMSRVVGLTIAFVFTVFCAFLFGAIFEGFIYYKKDKKELCHIFLPVCETDIERAAYAFSLGSKTFVEGLFGHVDWSKAYPCPEDYAGFCYGYFGDDDYDKLEKYSAQ